jgi:hypothetical protein
MIGVAGSSAPTMNIKSQTHIDRSRIYVLSNQHQLLMITESEHLWRCLDENWYRQSQPQPQPQRKSFSGEAPPPDVAAKDECELGNVAALELMIE